MDGMCWAGWGMGCIHMYLRWMDAAGWIRASWRALSLMAAAAGGVVAGGGGGGGGVIFCRTSLWHRILRQCARHTMAQTHGALAFALSSHLAATAAAAAATVFV